MMIIKKISLPRTIILNTIKCMHTHITTVPTNDMYWPTTLLCLWIPVYYVFIFSLWHSVEWFYLNQSHGRRVRGGEVWSLEIKYLLDSTFCLFLV